MTRNQQQRTPPTPTQKKDAWDIVDILLKGVLAVGVSGALTFYSITAERETRAENIRAEEERNAQDQRAKKERSAQDQRAEQDRRAQTLIEMVNARESADSDLRAKMFQILMQHYFNPDDIESQIVVLELIGLNFRDSLQIKPMFEQLDRQLKRKSNDPRALSQREQLRDAARAMINDQLRQIERAKDGYVCRSPVLDEGEPWELQDDCMLSGKLTLKKVNEDQVEILPADTGDEPFTVNFYDMPMVDFTQKPNFKYAVVLTNTNHEEKTATLALSVLPTAIFNSQLNSYQFDALLFHYLPQKD